MVFRDLVYHHSLGSAFFGNRDITQVVLRLFPVTASVVAGGALLWLAFSVPLGILSAVRARSLLDRAVLATTLLALCVHPLVVGLVLSYLVGFRLGWADPETADTLMNGENAIPQTLVIDGGGRIVTIGAATRLDAVVTS